jgi:hypothetical protein
MSGAKGAGTERLGRRKRFSLCRTEYFGRLGMVKVIFGSVAAFPNALAPRPLHYK